MKKSIILLLVLLCLIFNISANADIFLELKPSSVSNFTAKLNNNDSVILKWNAALYADSYEIQKSVTFDGEYVSVARGITKLTYTDKDCDGNVYYKIIPYNENGSGTPVTTKSRAVVEKKLQMPVPEGHTVVGMVVIDDYIYTAESGNYTLSIYKIGDEEITPVYSEKIETYDATAITQSGDYIYIAIKPQRGNRMLSVYSIKDREKPVLVHSMVADSYTMLKVYDNYLLCGGSAGVRVIDITNPEEATTVTTVEDIGTSKSMHLDGNMLYIVNTTGELYCLNVVNMKVPLKYSTLDYSFETYVNQESMLTDKNWEGETYFWLRTYAFDPLLSDIYAKNGYSYIATEYGVKTADTKNYKKPEYITPKDSTTQTINASTMLIADGNLLYSINNMAFAVYNISNPSEARLVEKHLPIGGSAIAGLSVENGRVITVNVNGYIAVYE